jgi:cell division septum initiation protein DivIVA
MYFIQCSLGLGRMRDKNEAINLWLLELDRQKNRARVLEETTRKSTVQSPSNQHDPWFNCDESHKEENKQIAICEAADLEHLMKEKGSLEEESQCLDEAQKKLDQRAKMLTEKIIQEIKKRNSEKKQAIDQLRARMHRLEAQIGSLSVPNTPQKIKVRKPEPAKTNQYQT